MKYATAKVEELNVAPRGFGSNRTRGRSWKFSVLAAHATVAWASCAALIVIGQQLTSMDRTLIIHAAGSPLAFALIARFYFRRFAFTTALKTAVLFLLVVVSLDVIVVALLIEGSFAMFKSPLGTWLPLSLSFLAVYATGCAVASRASTENGER